MKTCTAACQISRMRFVAYHLVSEMLAYYHEERPHQLKGNDPLTAGQPKWQKAEAENEKSPPDAVPESEIVRRQRLGGLLKHYYRQAARASCRSLRLGDW